MLNEPNPPRRVSQAPLKEGLCHAGCGQTIAFRTNPRVCCPACRVNRRLQAARANMASQRRKRGIPRVKGTVIQCSRCGVDVMVNRNRGTRYCRPCYRENDREASRRSSAAKFATEAGRKYARDYEREKRRTDSSYRVSSHMRVRMHRALNGKKAGRSWRELVPYSLEKLMAHLERQFLPGMSWANKGEWHIDHVIPLSSFSFESPRDPEFQAAWALSNLRPLWGRDNIRKNARRLHLL